jgi:hypothetical protein
MARNHNIVKGNPIHNLYRFYWNNNISRPRLLNHARAHRAYVNSQNGTGIYTAYLVILDAKILAFANAITGKDTDLSLQYGKTSLTNTSIKAFSDKVHEIMPYIVYTFRATPEVVLEFAPHGLSEFNNIAMENAQSLMNFFNTAVEAHAASFASGDVTWFASQATSHETTRANQQAAFGDVGDDIGTIITTKTGLIAALVAGHGIVSYNNSTSETAALLFFNYTLLYRSRDVAHLKVDGETLLNSTSLGKLILLDEFDMVGLWNKGTVARVGVFASLTEDGVPGIDTVVKWATPGAHANISALALGATVNHYIKLFVDNLTDGTTWELDFYDM